MRILSLIRSAPQIRLSPRTLRGAECAFWFVLALALSFGGRAALSGLLVLAGYFTPSGQQQAEPAEPYAAHEIQNLPMTEHRPTVDPIEIANATALAGNEDLSAPSAAKAAPLSNKALPAIVLVIDDLGPDVSGTRRVMALPAAVTMSFLPYGEHTPELALAAERAGHDVLAHVPMQPLGRENPGPMALRPGMPGREITRRLRWDLSRVPGRIGINNHMGSRFTEDRTGLVPVMQQLMDCNLFFFDSVTSPHSVAMQTARAFGILSARRDVFLDDTVSAAAVHRQLKLLERVARHQGIALAIGHPHKVTLDALENWCANLHGFRLVRIRTGLKMKTARDMGVPVASLSTPPAR